MRNRLIPGMIVAIGLSLAAAIYVQERRAMSDWRERSVEHNRLMMLDTAEDVQDYFESVYSLLHAVSLDQQIVTMQAGSRPSLEKLLQNGLERNRLTEVYVVQRGFDGTDRPFMTFEREPEKDPAGRWHTLEREQEEYDVQTRQLKRFTEEAQLRALLSREILLCVGGQKGERARGFVYSVPIEHENQIVGMVAGMLRSDVIRSVLHRDPERFVAGLVEADGEILVESGAPMEVAGWLKDKKQLNGLFAKAADGKPAEGPPGWVALQVPLSIESGDRMRLVYLYPKESEQRPNALLGTAGHAALGGSLLLTTIALALLVSSMNRRIDEQAQHLKERKELERAVQEVSDREKRRAGESLHEDLCQRLTGINAVATVLERTMRATGLPEADIATELADEVKGSLRQALEMADELQPVSMLRHGFVAAIRKLADNLEERAGITCKVSIEEFPESLSEPTSTHLYRIIQEACNNVVLHAKATILVLELIGKPETLAVTIRDNGQGFEPDKRKTSGMGLRIMAYRADLLGGTLHIVSAPGKGTSVTCSCPAKMQPLVFPE